MSDTSVVGVRGIEHCEVGVPAQVDTSRAQGGGALELLDGGVRPAPKRRKVAEAWIAVVVCVPAACERGVFMMVVEEEEAATWH